MKEYKSCKISGTIKSTKMADHIVEMPEIRFFEIINCKILLLELGLRIYAPNFLKIKDDLSYCRISWDTL